jgi:hypothetical protein
LQSQRDEAKNSLSQMAKEKALLEKELKNAQGISK